MVRGVTEVYVSEEKAVVLGVGQEEGLEEIDRVVVDNGLVRAIGGDTNGTRAGAHGRHVYKPEQNVVHVSIQQI